MIINDNNFTQKNSLKFVCESCRFVSSKKNDYNRHLLTRKHLMITNDNKKTQESVKTHQCICGKDYKYASGLSFHRKKCKYKECENKIVNNEDVDINYKEFVMKLLIENQNMQKENQKLLNTITDIIPVIGNNNTNNNSNNNNTVNNNQKQKFNINVFLNEKCKDAISMDEFIDTIEVSMKNLLTTRDKGLDEGLSSIIIDNMNKLSLYERPMHCTDKKRETMYIKNKELGKR